MFSLERSNFYYNGNECSLQKKIKRRKPAQIRLKASSTLKSQRRFYYHLDNYVLDWDNSAHDLLPHHIPDTLGS